MAKLTDEEKKRRQQERSRQYRLKNLDQVKEYKRQYRLKNLDRHKEHQRQYYLKNKDQVKESNRQYRLKNKVKKQERISKDALLEPIEMTKGEIEALEATIARLKAKPLEELIYKRA
ncbi:MAG: hypothetical protein AB3P25_05665 [Candidatus Liberibacter psyllaurous]